MRRILSTWKEIAQYVGKGVRTVQRWEQLGLPVRRPETRRSVIAYTDDLDAWLAGSRHSYSDLQARIAELEAENDRLRAELRAALNTQET